MNTTKQIKQLKISQLIQLLRHNSGSDIKYQLSVARNELKKRLNYE